MNHAISFELTFGMIYDTKVIRIIPLNGGEVNMRARREREIRSLHMDKDINEGLRRLSDRLDVSVSQLIREFVREGLERSSIELEKREEA
jgi:hypothetical protein